MSWLHMGSRLWSEAAGMFFSFKMSHAHLISFRTSTTIIDKENRVIAIMASQPDCQDWDKVHTQMNALLEQTATDIPGPHKD